VLGIGGWGTILASGQTSEPQVVNGRTTIGPLDLFRYGALDTPSLTTSTSAVAYFSLDSGATSIAGFNQSGSGDYGDWNSSACYVQTFQVCSNPIPISLASPEGLALQAIGYDPVPEPFGLALLSTALAGLGLARWKRRSL
jgi:hypothetical protein